MTDTMPTPTRRRYISASACEAWEFCQRAYENRYVLKLKPADDVAPGAALVHGTGLHTGADHQFRGNPPDIALPAVSAELQRVYGPSLVADDIAKAQCLVRAYYRQWSRSDLRSAYAEVEMKQHLGGAWWFMGWADGVVFALDVPAPLLRETKTTSATLDDAEAVLRVSPQIHLYMEMLRRQYGLECRGVLADLVKKPWSDGDGGGAVRRRKDEPELADYLARCEEAMAADPSRYFRRTVIDYDGNQVELAVEALRRASVAIERAEAEGYHSILGHRCRTPFGQWCEYKPYCWHNDASKFQMGNQGDFDGRKEGIATNGDGRNGNAGNDHDAARDNGNDGAAGNGGLGQRGAGGHDHPAVVAGAAADA